MNNVVLKRVGIALVAVAAVLVCVCMVALGMLEARTDALRDDWSAMQTDAKYATSVQVEGVEVITQDVFESMPLFFKLAFAFNIFEKNTVFIVER